MGQSPGFMSTTNGFASDWWYYYLFQQPGSKKVKTNTDSMRYGNKKTAALQ
jgi:hypothetical protein